MEGRRIERIEEQLRIELSEIIEREIQDPRVGLTTVTAVRVSPDMRHARVFVSVLGSADERKKALQGLSSAASFVRRSLSQRLHHLRRIPHDGDAVRRWNGEFGRVQADLRRVNDQVLSPE